MLSRKWSVKTLEKLMADRTKAPDELLPRTGVGIEWERELSAKFIEMPNYGTRCTTILLIDNAGKVSFTEVGHKPPHRVRFEFQIG